jgi:mannose/cellobiose epimerase-like protein (N-acyl-D-glucosamine 2-epimerase family)
VEVFFDGKSSWNHTLMLICRSVWNFNWARIQSCAHWHQIVEHGHSSISVSLGTVKSVTIEHT